MIIGHCEASCERHRRFWLSVSHISSCIAIALPIDPNVSCGSIVHAGAGKLITATLLANACVGWKYDLYFHHCNDWNAASLYDYGFWVDDVYGSGPQMGDYRRKVSQAAALLHQNTGVLKLGAPDTKIWIPLQRRKPNGLIAGALWCGWQTNTFQEWGAIWRYRYNSNIDSSYKEEARTTEVFKIPGPDNRSNYSKVEVYKIDYSAATLSLGSPVATIDSINWGYAGGNIEITITNQVDEEPAFLKFYKK